MQIPAPGDVAVDLDDARGRLVPRLHIHGLRLHRLDAVPHVLDQGTVPVPAGAGGQRLGGTQRRQLTEGGDGSVLVQLDDAHVVVDGEPAVNCDEPVMVNGVTSVTSNVLVFVMVSDELPDDPTVTMAKLTLVGDAVIVAETMPME